MSIIIGIDAGISSTKIIGIENGNRIMTPMTISSSDPISAIHGAFGKYLLTNHVKLEDVEQVMLTGIGALKLTSLINGRPPTIVSEFKAHGLGARFDTGLDQFVVVSMGTGTSLVRVDGEEITHIGGLGMGGGTLQGLSRLLLNTSDIEEVLLLAEYGSADYTNLKIKDICESKLGDLTGDATASLFAKVLQHKPSDNVIAAGLIHMVLETIGSAAVLSQINGGFKNFVLIGRLTELLTSFKYIFSQLESLYDVHFHIPKYAPYCTALGAALIYKYEND